MHNAALLKREEEPVQLAAAEALARLGTEAAVKELSNRAKDADRPRVREAACRPLDSVQTSFGGVEVGRLSITPVEEKKGR